MPPLTNQPAERGVPEANASFSAITAESALSEALNVLRKRKWVLIIAAILGILYAVYQAATQPIVYTASGRIQVARPNGQASLGVSTGNLTGSLQSEDLETEVLIISSDSLMLSVAQEMNLANNPDFMGPGPYRNINDPIVRAAVVGKLANSFKVASIPRTQMIRIAVTASKAQLAADLVNHLINAYQQRSFESRFASTQRVSQWLQGQLDDLKQQVEASQEQLMDLQKKIGVLGLGADASKPVTTQVTAAVEALSNAAIMAKVQRILAESRYRVLSSSDPTLMESNLQAQGQGQGQSELSRLRDDASQTKATIAQTSVTLGPKNPQILALQAHLREVDREIQTEETRMVTDAKQALVAAQANESQTEAALEDQKNQSYRLRDDLVEYTLRQRDYETNRALYEALLAKLRSASVQAGLDALEIDVVDPAYKPVGPTITPRSSILGRDLIISLVLGVMLAFALESLDTGIRSVAEVEHITQLPSLSIIPRVRRMSSDGSGAMTVAQTNIGVLATSKSQFSEAFRSLRTALLLATTGHPPKFILISSSTPSEGKTTVSTNLAAILAQRETRVLLIDADLRRPNVHHRFGLNGRIGLSTVLSGGATLEEAAKNVPEVPNLDVLCSGPVPPFPTEMLSSESMQNLLKQCGELYTHVVIDSPPILSVTDAVILAHYADAIVMVVRHGKSSRNVVRRARDLLVRSGAAVTGVVLNSVDINAPEYHGYYGYSGYSYSNIDSESWESHGNDSERNNKGDEA
ncbi:polysaccharide biosynthesis tyrosine autokinase [Terriglobus sp. TAA 43]|uniref:GumC family protein n=1 Tax=Terriglobus sp. TAA 43 TaxID=278961 RepID=UPI00068C6232|nr:polysaccharide biosynthesis tyrosine autokinase [Terriglobus sp. TAA 43]